MDHYCVAIICQNEGGNSSHGTAGSRLSISSTVARKEASVSDSSLECKLPDRCHLPMHKIICEGLAAPILVDLNLFSFNSQKLYSFFTIN